MSASGNITGNTLACSPLQPAHPPQPALPALILEEVLQKLKEASVAFNTPEKATVGKQVVIQAKFSPFLPPRQLAATLDVPGRREIDTLKVSDRMAATLSGGTAFDVTPAGPQEQWISDKETTV